MQTGSLPLFLPDFPAPDNPQNNSRQEYSTPARQQLWLCIHFPRLPLEIRVSEGDQPVAIADMQTRRVMICSSSAQELGISSGMPLSAAYALCSDLLVREQDFRAEKNMHETLAAWAGQFSSVVSLQSPFGLLLEIQGSLKLFGGLTSLRQQIEQGLKKLGHVYDCAVAPTPRAAWWLAHNGRDDTIEDMQKLRSVLGGLSVANVCEDIKHTRELNKAGLYQLSDLFRLPADGLARRFGRKLVEKRHQVLGELPDPRVPFVMPSVFDCTREFSMATRETEPVVALAERLLLSLEGFLRARDAGVQKIEFRLGHERRADTHMSVGLSRLSRDPHHILALFRERLERMTLVAPVTRVRLRVSGFSPFEACSDALFSTRQQADENWWQTVEQLQARMGHDAVSGLSPLADHRPECAWTRTRPGEQQQELSFPARPSWLLPKPRRLAVRDGQLQWHGTLTLQQGPERIEQGWWDGNDVSRDY